MEARRLNPRLWDTDWLMLRGLASTLKEQLGSHLGKGARLIDLGCGDMPYRTAIEQLGVSYRGADIVEGADLLIGPDGKVDLPDGSADAVLSIQVLEHVRDLDAYCAEAQRLLGPDGTLFLSTHGNWLYHPHPEDHWRWTRTGLEAALNDRGFAVCETRALVGPLATTTIIRLTGFAWVIRKVPVLGGIIAGALAVVMNARAWLEDCITPVNLRDTNACIYWVRARKVAA